MKKNLYLASAVAFIVLLALVTIGLQGTHASIRLAQENQEHSIPELRALEQMRFGILRIVSSTAEIIVLHEAQSEERSKEAALIEEGDREFNAAVQRLSELEAQSMTVAMLDLQEISRAHQALLDVSRRIVRMSGVHAHWTDILAAKEEFELAETKALEVLDKSLSVSQTQANRNLGLLQAQLGTLRTMLELLGLISVIVIGAYLVYVIRLLAEADAAKHHAEALAAEHAREVERRKNIEGRLAAHQKLESLGTLVGGIAHSVNNFLVPIITLSKMLKHDAPAGSELHEDASRILTSGEKASAVLRNVMAFSRTGTTNTTGQCDLVQCLERSLSIARSALPSTIRLAYSNQAPEALVAATETDIDAMLLNLIGNAVDAIDGKPGNISVTLGLTTIAGGKFGDHAVKVPDGDYAHLMISDDGAGIPPEILDNIFDPFFTTKPVGKGTGLGLSISYGTVSTAGGEIDVCSAQGAGTRFDILFPVQTAATDHPDRSTTP